jgi:hypothetical protein
MTHVRPFIRRLALLALVVVLSAGIAAGAKRPLTAHAAAAAPPAGASTPVYRYWSQTALDWVSSPAGGNQPSPADWAQLGYTQDATPQFYVDMVGGADMVAVYRWWQPSDQDWVDIVDGSMTDAGLMAAGYQQKTFQWYAWPTQVSPDMVAVYRWWQPSDRDWVTLRQDEIPDATLQSWGYTQKTFLSYTYPYRSSDGTTGYFNLGTVQSSVLHPMPWSTDPQHSGLQSPHTFSVLDVNPGLSPNVNQGYRFLGYYGHVNCAGIGIARSNDLVNWVQDPNALLQGNGERWASVLQEDTGIIDMVHNVNYCTDANYTIVGRTSTDSSGTAFSTTTTTLVSEPDHHEGNPTLFKDPVSGRIYLYWFRGGGPTDEIRVKSADTFADLLAGSASDIGQLVAQSPMTVAAPQVMYSAGIYYLAVETNEAGMPGPTPSNTGTWRTRVLASTSPTGPFTEVPGNPLYGDGTACVFQHVVNGVLHSFFCHEATPGSGDWSLDEVSGDLSSPPPPITAPAAARRQ